MPVPLSSAATCEWGGRARRGGAYCRPIEIEKGFDRRRVQRMAEPPEERPTPGWAVLLWQWPYSTWSRENSPIHVAPHWSHSHFGHFVGPSQNYDLSSPTEARFTGPAHVGLTYIYFYLAEYSVNVNRSPLDSDRAD